jgi:hypothetical protein
MSFDFNNLRPTPTFKLGAVAKKLITTIPVKKPRWGLEFFKKATNSQLKIKLQKTSGLSRLSA